MRAQLPSSNSGPLLPSRLLQEQELTRRRPAHLPGSLGPGSHSPPKARVLLVASRSTAGPVIVASRSPASHRGPLLSICSPLTTPCLCLPRPRLPPPSRLLLLIPIIISLLLLAEATRPCRLLSVPESDPESQIPPVPSSTMGKRGGKRERKKEKKKEHPDDLKTQDQK